MTLMRPKILFSLFTGVRGLPGIGPRLGNFLEKLAGPNSIDLCWHFPNGIIDRRFSPKIKEAPSGKVATLIIEVIEHVPPRVKRLPYKVLCGDETGELTLVFFHAERDYLEKILPSGEKRVISGKIEFFKDQVQMLHPDHIVELKKANEIQTVEAIYPLTTGLTFKPLIKAIKGTLEILPELNEWQDSAWLNKNAWPSWRKALLQVHNPKEISELLPNAPARERLAYDELLADQLALSIVRLSEKRKVGRSVGPKGTLLQNAISSFPYKLTHSQENALEEILIDMKKPIRMLRMLQGDVGSGKTIVAFLAMLRAVENGTQAALMVPTEILARQHFQTILTPSEKLGVKVAILTGQEKRKSRDRVLQDLKNGAISIVIGTHALFQKDVIFNDLALTVVDEQHRFGVHQRLMLADKGSAADMLVMTATPIPRTLMLCAYSDLDSSRLLEKPKNRKPVETRVVPLSKIDQVIERLKQALKSDAQVFWVCPLIEESELINLAAATSREDDLKQHFPAQVGLIHGQMKSAEKQRVMKSFLERRIKILVSTTVIEVGVDIPHANIMVIEHAERFGLSQIHQLRGRVGRGETSSSCLLLYAPPLTSNSRSRLNILRNSNDGFQIAEEDLKLRGAGELLGTKQSGLPNFKNVDFKSHLGLMLAARDDAKLILVRDPELTGERGKALRVLLYLFEKDSVIQTLRSG